MRFPTMWYVRPAKPQISLSLIRAFASRLNILLLLGYWLNILWSSMPIRRLHRLVRVYTCQNATLLEITCHGSFYFSTEKWQCFLLFIRNISLSSQVLRFVLITKLRNSWKCFISPFKLAWVFSSLGNIYLMFSKCKKVILKFYQLSDPDQWNSCPFLIHLDWLQSLKQYFINVPYHNTCSQSNSDGSVLKQSHQS